MKAEVGGSAKAHSTAGSFAKVGECWTAVACSDAVDLLEDCGLIDYRGSSKGGGRRLLEDCIMIGSSGSIDDRGSMEGRGLLAGDFNRRQGLVERWRLVER